MASSVFYKWASRKDESRVSFDGTGISVFDLKRDIILANRMDKANDFDLVVLDAATKQEYKDDSFIIPRSSSVIVKRVPSFRPGRGRASYYTANSQNVVPTSEPVRGSSGSWHRGAMSKRFDTSVKDEPPRATGSPAPIKPAPVQDDEAAAMAAMFQAQNANWEETQEKMSHATKIYSNTRGSGFSRGGKPYQPSAQPTEDRPLPASYVCYRCGQKGHWIKDCPTNSDRDFDNRPRIKRTTGIPRSMLKAVDNPSTDMLSSGVMVTPEGGYVVAQPDSVSWQKQVSRLKGLSAADVRERAPSDPTLACPIDGRLFRDAVKTPCCGTSYCEECIQTHLLEKDFACPSCGKRVASLDKLSMDKPTRTKVADYIEKVMEESRKAEDAAMLATGDSDPSLDQELYSDQQPGMVDVQQMLIDNIPPLQAQITQLNTMLQRQNLPAGVRQTTEMQLQQLRMQLAQAQAMLQLQQQMPGAMWPGAVAGVFSGQQQPQPQVQPPISNRKRGRPEEFTEVGGEKVPRYWQ